MSDIPTFCLFTANLAVRTHERELSEFRTHERISIILTEKTIVKNRKCLRQLRPLVTLRRTLLETELN